MTSNSLKLKLAAVAVGLTVCLTPATPAEAIIEPVKCGTVKAKGKRWRVTADQLPCSTAKKWAVSYIRSFKTPRYYKCYRAADRTKYRVCDTRASGKYKPVRTFIIYKPR